jgi:hypothetical protein
MAIPPCGTFEIVVVVPQSGEDRAPWRVQLCKPIEPTGDDLRDDRLVGHSPRLEISDAGMTPDVRTSPFTGTAGPRVLRSRMTLTASKRKHARVASVAFHVDQALTMALLPSDMLFLARTACGGLALSIVRDGQLVAAAGAVSAVPLGELVHVRIPIDEVREAEGVFRKSDPEFEFRELPIEIRLGELTGLLHRGRLRHQSYEVFVEHGFYPGLPGTNECVAVSLTGTCPDIAAVASAQLLDSPDALEIVRWGT